MIRARLQMGLLLVLLIAAMVIVALSFTPRPSDEPSQVQESERVAPAPTYTVKQGSEVGVTFEVGVDTNGNLQARPVITEDGVAVQALCMADGFTWPARANGLCTREDQPKGPGLWAPIQ